MTWTTRSRLHARRAFAGSDPRIVARRPCVYGVNWGARQPPVPAAGEQPAAWAGPFSAAFDPGNSAMPAGAPNQRSQLDGEEDKKEHDGDGNRHPRAGAKREHAHLNRNEEANEDVGAQGGRMGISSAGGPYR